MVFFNFNFLIFLGVLLASNISPKCVDGFEKKKFLTTKYDEANIRNGPGLKNLIVYKILHKGYPLKIIGVFENWKKIEDFSGRTGWISNSQLSSDEFAIVTANKAYIHMFPDSTSKLTAEAHKGVILSIIKCKEKWCKIIGKGHQGWIKKNILWGVE
tara:strand:+ start:94 stop:564 length:471 start_codon:yes stop_codon:yes gene_type:complete